jgi:hypothetical protein
MKTEQVYFISPFRLFLLSYFLISIIRICYISGGSILENLSHTTIIIIIIIIIIPVIIGATGIVTKSLKKNLEAISGKHSIDSLQKAVILGTSHILWKVLRCGA